MRVEVFSDVVCPWCYIGKRHLEAALAGFEAAGEVEVIWRSFELDPDHPRRPGGTLVERLAAKYGTSAEGAQQMIDQMTERAAAAGLEYDLGSAVPANTFDAHRLLALARERGRDDAAEERLLAAHMVSGEDLGDHAVLLRIAAEIGLDPDEAAHVLESGAYGDHVRADEREAAELGVTGVPFFVLDGRYGVAGAQPPETLLAALRHAHGELAEREAA